MLANRPEGGDSHRLVLEVPGWPGAEPGQFIMLSAGARGAVERTDPLLPRPMAVYRGHAPAADAAGARVEVLYRAAGRGTRLIAEVLPAQLIRLVGPLGRAFPAIEPDTTAVLVGGGTGVASLFELAARAAGRARLSLILGARTASDLMGRDDFAELEVDLEITTEDGSEGRRGLVTDALAPLLGRVSGLADAVVYACGPTPMMRACAELAESRGVRCIVSLENHMACGFGVCLGCAVPSRHGGFSLVCQSGPVFEAGDVQWEGLP